MSSSVCTQRFDATLLHSLVTFPQPHHLPSSRPHTAARSFAHRVQLSTFYCPFQVLLPARRVRKLRALIFSVSYSVGSTYVSRLRVAAALLLYSAYLRMPRGARATAYPQRLFLTFLCRLIAECNSSTSPST